MGKIKRLLPLILFCLLGISIGANYVLFSAAQKYYLEVQAARFNPLSLDAYREDVPEKSTLPRVVFYGDSRAFQWPFPDSDQFDFYNRGIGAQTSNQILLRYEEHVAPLDPDILLVQMCINELKTVPIFPTKRKQILASCRQ
ncbi:MAG: SGNH/GDSL hydrolase family protein, partial [Anaerolineae bacterium]